MINTGQKFYFREDCNFISLLDQLILKYDQWNDRAKKLSEAKV